MTHKGNQRHKSSSPDLSRREFLVLPIAAGVGTFSSALVTERSVVETNVDIKTADGTCDAALFHPSKGSHPGVLIWPDSGSLRPAFREIGKRLAAEGYSVLIPNHLYRMARAPVFPESFDPVKSRDDAAFYRRVTAPFFAPGAVERDARAYIEFLQAQRQVNTRMKIGVAGYCLGGAYVMRTAALFPNLVGAGVSFHGGFLVTDKPDSPHLLAPKIKPRLYFAIASDDDAREPEVKNKLRDAFTVAKVRAEIEVYANALHGWCVPDTKKPNKPDAERAWSKLVALYKKAL